MCRVREGADVISKADLQNLVTSVILRQTSTFSAKEISDRIRLKLEGSRYYDSHEVEERCRETISTLYTINCILSVEKGRYKLAMSFPSVVKR